MTATALRAPAAPRAGAARPRLRIVGARRTPARDGLPAGARLAVAFAVVVCFGALSVQAFVQVGQVRLRDLTVRTSTAQQRYTEARLEYARAASPARIVARAEALGLRAGATPRYVGVPRDAAASATRIPTSSTAGYRKVKPSLDARP